MMRRIGDCLDDQWTMLARAVMESIFQDIQRNFRVYEIKRLLNKDNQDLFAAICGVAKMDEGTARRLITEALAFYEVRFDLTNDKSEFTMPSGRVDLRGLLKDKGMTMGELARLANVTLKTVYRIADGTLSAKHLDRLGRVADVLGMEWRDLL